MNAEKLKKDIGRAITWAQSVHDEVVEKFTSDGVDREVMTDALNITYRLEALVWYLEGISEGVSV